MKIILKLLIIIYILLNYESAFASTDSLIVEARLLFYKSITDKTYIPKTMEIFKTLESDSSYKGKAMTYIGALTAIKGKFSLIPILKYTYVKKGLSLMDKGIEHCPDDLESLFIRGSTCFYLPFFFGRKDDAQEDFKSIILLLPEKYSSYNPDLLENVIVFLKENVSLNRKEYDTLSTILLKIKNYED